MIRIKNSIKMRSGYTDYPLVPAVAKSVSALEILSGLG
jgi:hypothetical protein